VIVGRASEMLAEAEEERSEAEITAVSGVEKEPVVAANEADVELAGTVTEAGTVTLLLLTASPTVDPPAGAVWDSLTVQVVLALGKSVVGAQVREVTVSGATSEIAADWEDPFKDAVVVAV
jgi:phage tail sheath gpL-like